MFVLTVMPGRDVPISTLHKDGEYIARVPVGFDDETGAIYSVFAALSPIPGMADIPGLEFIFSIVEGSPDREHARECLDGLETKQIIPDANDRTRIRNVIFMAARQLILLAKPNVVSMTTHTANLPSKALGKFYEICRVFQIEGFKGGPADSYHGCHIWMMERVTEETDSP